MSKSYNPSVRSDMATGAITAKCIAGAHRRAAHPGASGCSSFATGQAHARAKDAGGLSAPRQRTPM